MRRFKQTSHGLAVVLAALLMAAIGADSAQALPHSGWAVRGVQITPGGGSTDNDFNNNLENRAILENVAPGVTGTFGPFPPNANAVYNVSTNTPLEASNQINYSGGRFGGDQTVPGGLNNQDDYSIQGFAELNFPAGNWAVAFGRDDGGQLTFDTPIPGGITGTFSLNGPQPANGIAKNNTGGHAFTGMAFTVPAGGYTTMVDTSFFERGGGDSFEVVVAQITPGSSFFNNGGVQNNGFNPWRILGDGQYGVSVTNSVGPTVFTPNNTILPEPPGQDLGNGTGNLLNRKTFNGMVQYDLTDPEGNGAPDADIGYDASFSANDEPGFGGGEFSFNVFDNGVGGGNNKWCCNGTNNGAAPKWVAADFGVPHVIDRFTITGGNDTPGRDPQVWEIQGSNDGTTWTTIYAQSTPGVQAFIDRNEVRLFEAGTDYATPPAYRHVRYFVSETGNNNHQINELEFFSDAFNASFVLPEHYNTRMVRIAGGNGATDTQINNMTEGEMIYLAATGTGPVMANGQTYNVNIFAEDVRDRVNMGGGNGNFGGADVYPHGSNNGGNDFIVAVNTYARIPEGTYSISVASDDGRLLRLTDWFFDSVGDQGTLPGGPFSSEIRFEGTTGHNQTVGHFVVPPEGIETEIFAMFFERGGGDSFEISIAQGIQNNFNGNFVLLTDGVFGITLSNEPFAGVPEPATATMLGLVSLTLLRRRRRA